MFGFAPVRFCFKNCYCNLNFTQKSWRRKIEWDQMNKVLVFKGTRPTLTERISRRLERASLALFGPCTIFTWVRGQTIKKPREWVEMACLSNKRKNSHENWSGSPSAWMKSKVFDWPVYLWVRFCVFDFHSILVFDGLPLMNPEFIYKVCFLFLFDFQDVTESSFLSRFNIIHLPYG